MTLDLADFDKNTNQITFDLIECFFCEEENKKPISNQPVRFVTEGDPNHQKHLWFLKTWFLISCMVLIVWSILSFY